MRDLYAIYYDILVSMTPPGDSHIG